MRNGDQDEGSSLSEFQDERVFEMSLPASPLAGLHHVTASIRDARLNHAFYATLLGQRLVKQTVRLEEPGICHLYYGNERGAPGSLSTFFVQPEQPGGRAGSGLVSRVSYLVPRGALDYWHARLTRELVAIEEISGGEHGSALRFMDPNVVQIALVEGAEADELPGWRGSADHIVDRRYAIRGLHGLMLSQWELAPTADFLGSVLGLSEIETAASGRRFRVGDDAICSTLELEQNSLSGRRGVGTVHHIAFLVADEAALEDWRRHLTRHRLEVSPIVDRVYFQSIGFREPGGVLLEIATEAPGFTVDEPLEFLGCQMRLPAELEPQRERIEDAWASLRL